MESDTTEPTKEDINSFEKDMQYVYVPQDSLLKKLFDFVPDRPGDYSMDRKVYIKAMLEVQKEFQLEEGNTKLLLFILEQLSRSPKIIDSLSSEK
jgi:hypothetical protein